MIERSIAAGLLAIVLTAGVAWSAESGSTKAGNATTTSADNTTCTANLDRLGHEILLIRPNHANGTPNERRSEVGLLMDHARDAQSKGNYAECVRLTDEALQVAQK